MLPLGVNDHCGCSPVSADHRTREGGNEIITRREKRIYKELKGTIEDANGNKVSDALVEVFKDPEWILKDFPKRPSRQERLRACLTQDDGSFCFSDLPAGKYELRVSKATDINPSHIYVLVDAGKGITDSLDVMLRPGT